jgi:hypothetical protein
MTVRLLQHRAFAIKPFQVGGQTPGGVWLENERGESLHDRRLPCIFGRVTQVSPSCRDVRVGDWVCFPPNRPIRVRTKAGNIYVLTESSVLGIVQAPDGEPWFDAA